MNFRRLDIHEVAGVAALVILLCTYLLGGFA